MNLARRFRGRTGLLLFPVLFLALLAALAPTGAAQEVSAGITGKITDPTGASIAAVSVTARDMDRGTTWTSQTNAEGIYFFPRIPPGRYELLFEAQGFKKAVRSNVALDVNQRARLDVLMEIGTLTESIEVKGEAPLLNTDTTIVGTTVGIATLVNTPLSGRNFIELTLLAPGVNITSPDGLRMGERTGYALSRPYVNGNRAQANNFMLDGVDNNMPSDNYTAYLPNPDAVQEVRTITNNASAEFGNFQGAVINVVMKSGTNHFHGSAFEFIRGDGMDANNWARNWQGTPKAPYSWHQFGGTVGGPIKRDRLFFFADYQGFRRDNPGGVNKISVIPDDFRSGDFSRLLPDTQVYDPLNLDANGNRLPFAGNRIPASRISPVAKKLFASNLYPGSSAPRFNADNTVASSVTTDQGDLRIDYKPRQSDDISFRYSNSHQERPTTNSFPLIFDNMDSSPFVNAVINWTRSIGPSLVNEARFGLNRHVWRMGDTDKGLGNVGEDLGIAGSNARAKGLMLIDFQGGFATDIGSQQIGGAAMFANNTFHWADNLTVIRGRHMVKVGGQLLRQQNNIFYGGNNGRSGLMRFNGQFSGPIGGAAIAEADFVLGHPYDVGMGFSAGTWGHRSTIYGFYGQDDWRLTNSLTLQFGLRWEYHSPFVEVKDRQTNFGLYSGEVMLAGQNGHSRALYNSYKRDFQPRLGFAWTPEALGRKTVIRGAYTISSYLEGTGTNLRLPQNPPWRSEFGARFSTTTSPTVTTENVLSGLKENDPWAGAMLRVWDPDNQPARSQQWSLIIERQLPGDAMVSAGYIGQHSTHLAVPMAYNQRQLRPGGIQLPSPYLAGNPSLVNNTIVGTATIGNSIYHGLQLTAQKRTSRGLTFQSSMTYAKAMTDSLGYYGDVGQTGGYSAYWQDVYNGKAEWGPAFFDAKFAWNSSFVYELPFGRKRAFGQAWNPGLDAILGNWQVGGLVYLRSGFAMTPMNCFHCDSTNSGSWGERADRVGDGDGPKTVGPGGSWFNKSAFRLPSAAGYGTSGNGVVRGPAFHEMSLSVQKSFPISEAKRFEFRAEAFNFTNTPSFQGVDTYVGSATFGEVTGSQSPRLVQIGLKFYF